MSRAITTDITVRYASGAYVTNTVKGERTSCTHSADEAARRLDRKLYGDGFERAEQIPDGATTAVSVWRLHGRPGQGGRDVL